MSRSPLPWSAFSPVRSDFFFYKALSFLLPSLKGSRSCTPARNTISPRGGRGFPSLADQPFHFHRGGGVAPLPRWHSPQNLRMPSRALHPWVTGHRLPMRNGGQQEGGGGGARPWLGVPIQRLHEGPCGAGPLQPVSISGPCEARNSQKADSQSQRQRKSHCRHPRRSKHPLNQLPCQTQLPNCTCSGQRVCGAITWQ